jgi:hypothetical protein
MPGHGFGGPQGDGVNFGGQQFGGPRFHGAGPGAQRKYTFTFGGVPNRQARGQGPQDWSQFFSTSQTGRPSKPKPNSGSRSAEQSGWANNLYNMFTGNDAGGFGDVGGMFGNGGGMFSNVFNSFGQGGGEQPERGGSAQETLNLPKEIEKLTPNKFKQQVLGTSKGSWAVMYFVTDYEGLSDRVKVLAAFAEEMKGVLKVC